MKNYIIDENTEDTSYDCIIYATSYMSPIDNINEIEKDLVGSKKSVIFELLLCFGRSSNRFVTATFDGEKFIKDSFHVLSKEEQNEKLLVLSQKFYIENQEYLDNSILSNAQKKLIKKGIYMRF